MDKIVKLNEQTIEKIKKNKLIYSIIKYEQADTATQDRLNDRYMLALNLNNDNFNENMYKEAEAYLKEGLEKVRVIRDLNQPIIDQTVSETLEDITKIFNSDDDMKLKCARMYQYVTKSITYAQDYLDYDVKIPFADDFEFACYNGIPIGKNYIDTLVTKEGTSLEICTLMQALGNVFGVNIKSIPVMKDDGIYYINSYENDTSYLDPTGTIKNNDDDGSPFLTKQDLLKKGIIIDTEFEKRPEGERLQVDIKNASNVEKAVSRERTSLESKIITVNEEELNEIINEELNKNKIK